MKMPRRGAWPASETRPLNSPIQPSVVYRTDAPATLDSVYAGETAGFTYAREGHPNASVLADRISAMEGAGQGLVTGSGMAAVATVLLSLCSSGDHAVGGDQLYGRSLKLMREDMPRLGIATSLADTSSADRVAAAVTEDTRLILVEVVSNPTIRVADLDAIVALARERGLLVAVDNTFTTPRAIRPFEHGADVVIHSVTKLLSGHSDATLGWVGTRDPSLMARIETFAVTTGLTASPFDCWLAERGLMSFDLRYDRAEENAARLAHALKKMPGVIRVLYPTASDHPDHAVASALLGNRGSHMVSFEIEGGRAAAERLVRALSDEIAFAPTLGDIATTLSHPLSSSHRGLTPADAAAIGLSEGFFRVSVGCEEIAGLTDAFARAAQAARG